MENASKALLIAAAVLIVIVIISGGVIALRAGQNSKKQASEVGEQISSTTQGIAGNIKDVLNKKPSTNQGNNENEEQKPQASEKPGKDEQPIEDVETIPTTESFVGYYADLDGNGEIEEDVDGIIYADMARGNTNGIQWVNSDGAYNIPLKQNLKEYCLSDDTVEGSFGTKKVVKVVDNDENKKDRFYVMALRDHTTNSFGAFYWQLNRNVVKKLGTTEAFGTGANNTNLLINTDKVTWSNRDIWKNLNGADGWFVPSRAEWSAFGQELGITSSNYESFGLEGSYWSSSQNNTYLSYAWIAYFNEGYMYYLNAALYYGNNVRLSTTF